MHRFTLLYLFYSAKLSSQASIYFIWLIDSSSRTIAFVAAAVAILAAVPFSHVIAHVFSAKPLPLSNPIFIAYLCFSFLLAILWYEPIQDGKQRVLPFAVVTAFDILDLFIFLFQLQIGRLHNILKPDIEQGHPRPEASADDASVALVGQGNEQSHHSDPGTRSEPSLNEIRRHRLLQDLGYDMAAINRSGRAVEDSSDLDPRTTGEQLSIHDFDGKGHGQASNDREAGGRSAGARRRESVGWGSCMVQTLAEREVEEADLNLYPPQRQSEFFVDFGVAAGTRVENPPLPQTPATALNVHPAYRTTLTNDSRPLSGGVFERNQI